MLRAAVIVDYQNVHLTAYDTFNRGGDRHDSLIHPAQFAKRAIIDRNARQRPGFAHATLVRVMAFRGLHHADYDYEQHRRATDQATQWRKDGAVVVLRDLKYTFKKTAGGQDVKDIYGRKEPVGRPVEKGIDVLCALAAVRETAAPDIDLVILASRDTDLKPVLDEVHDFHAMDSARYAAIETLSWHDSKGTNNRGPLVPARPRRIWNTPLGRDAYEASRDRNAY